MWHTEKSPWISFLSFCIGLYFSSGGIPSGPSCHFELDEMVGSLQLHLVHERYHERKISITVWCVQSFRPHLGPSLNRTLSVVTHWKYQEVATAQHTLNSRHVSPIAATVVHSMGEMLHVPKCAHFWGDFHSLRCQNLQPAYLVHAVFVLVSKSIQVFAPTCGANLIIL